MKILLTAAFMSLSLAAAAQTAPTEEPATKPATKKVEPKKTTPPPKKVATKKATPPAKPAAPTKVYVNDPKAPTLLDKSGNPIPTNPNAYDVSSATGKK